MATKTGTVKLTNDGTTKVLIVKDTPDYPFVNPETWAWDTVKGNAGQPITVTYTPGVPPAQDVVTGVEVG